MGKTDNLRALEKNCQLNSTTMIAQKRKKQKIIFYILFGGKIKSISKKPS